MNILREKTFWPRHILRVDSLLQQTYWNSVSNFIVREDQIDPEETGKVYNQERLICKRRNSAGKKQWQRLSTDKNGVGVCGPLCLLGIAIGLSQVSRINALETRSWALDRVHTSRRCRPCGTVSFSCGTSERDGAARLSRRDFFFAFFDPVTLTFDLLTKYSLLGLVS